MSGQVPEPVHPAWCDRDHAGFSDVTGVIEVEHRARRGSFELVQADVFDPSTGVVERDGCAVLTPDDDAWRADTPALLAARLRAEAAPLLALADLLDERSCDGVGSDGVLDGAGPPPDDEPIPVIERCVVVGWRWPDGEDVEFDDDGEPVSGPRHAGSPEA